MPLDASAAKRRVELREAQTRCRRVLPIAVEAPGVGGEPKRSENRRAVVDGDKPGHVVLASSRLLLAMHPILSLRNLNQLPRFMQASARGACAPNPTSADIQRVSFLLQKYPNNDNLLPVLYHLLDPAPISGSVDFESPALNQTLSNAMLVLGGFSRRLAEFSPKTVEALPDLLDRVSVWIVFLHDHRSHLGSKSELSSGNIGEDFLLLFDLLPTREKKQLLATQQIWVFLAAGWAKALIVHRPPPPAQILFSFAEALRKAEDITFHNVLLQAIFEGIDAGPEKLAELILLHLETAMHSIHKSPDVPDSSYLTYQGVVRLVLREPVFAHPTASVRNITELVRILMRDGLVTILSDLLGVLCSGKTWTATSLYTKLLSDSLFGLAVMFGLSPGNRQLPAALEHDLLRTLTRMACRADCAEIFPQLAPFFLKVLPPMLFQPAAIRALGHAMDSIPRGVERDFKSKEVLAEWTLFKKRVEGRVGLLTAVEALPKPKSLAVCANTTCNYVSDRRNLRLCSGCLSFFYCSKTCQKVDWRRGGHRTSCAAHRAAHFETRAMDLEVRDRAFLRALISHNKEATWVVPTVSNEKPQSFNDIRALVRLFELAAGDLSMCALIPGSPDEQTTIGVLSPAMRGAYDDLVRRAVASGGRQFVDVVSFCPGRARYPEDQRLWLLRGYTSRPFVEDYLRAQAEHPDDAEALWSSILASRAAQGSDLVEFCY
ncbi:MYND-type domain-containing protein [Mycena chlorophos]|uniref:MYND-type domain-containing protein n=1 Tax=Mycena chlorophos TaxID=658473 RepID=A0A8H6T8A3_MYCCL|nr:MYND-type domain-containing protein [Mycena chlorophos]